MAFCAFPNAEDFAYDDMTRGTMTISPAASTDTMGTDDSDIRLMSLDFGKLDPALRKMERDNYESMFSFMRENKCSVGVAMPPVHENAPASARENEVKAWVREELQKSMRDAKEELVALKESMKQAQEAEAEALMSTVEIFKIKSELEELKKQINCKDEDETDLSDTETIKKLNSMKADLLKSMAEKVLTRDLSTNVRQEMKSVFDEEIEKAMSPRANPISEHDKEQGKSQKEATLADELEQVIKQIPMTKDDSASSQVCKQVGAKVNAKPTSLAREVPTTIKQKSLVNQAVKTHSTPMANMDRVNVSHTSMHRPPLDQPMDTIRCHTDSTQPERKSVLGRLLNSIPTPQNISKSRRRSQSFKKQSNESTRRLTGRNSSIGTSHDHDFALTPASGMTKKMPLSKPTAPRRKASKLPPRKNEESAVLAKSSASRGNGCVVLCLSPRTTPALSSIAPSSKQSGSESSASSSSSSSSSEEESYGEDEIHPDDTTLSTRASLFQSETHQHMCFDESAKLSVCEESYALESHVPSSVAEDPTTGRYSVAEVNRTLEDRSIVKSPIGTKKMDESTKTKDLVKPRSSISANVPVSSKQHTDSTTCSTESFIVRKQSVDKLKQTTKSGESSKTGSTKSSMDISSSSKVLITTFDEVEAVFKDVGIAMEALTPCGAAEAFTWEMDEDITGMITQSGEVETIKAPMALIARENKA